MKKRFFVLLLTFAALVQTAAQTAYQRPPKDIEDMILAKPFPLASFNGDGSLGVVTSKTSNYLPIQEIVDMDEYKVGGLRINANNFSTSRYKSVITDLKVLKVSDGSLTQVAGLPLNPKISDIKWSPDGKVFCFLNTTDTEVELYRVEASSKSPKAEKINALKVNNTYGSAFTYMPDGKSIMYKGVPADIGAFPQGKLPLGPVVQRSNLKKYKYRTYQDLVKCFYDEEVYEYLCGSVLCIWDGKATKTVGPKSVFRKFTPSPDGSCVLVETERRPYSYVRSHLSFGVNIAAWDMSGAEVRSFKKAISVGTSKSKKDTTDVLVKPGGIVETELYEEDICEDDKKPVVTKNNFCWRPDEPATVAWIETTYEDQKDAVTNNDDDDDKSAANKDEDKENEKEKKDEPKYTTALWQFEYPFKYKSEKKELFKSEYKMSEVTWCDEGLAIYVETSSKEKFKRYMAFTPSDSVVVAEEIFRYSTEHDTVGNAPVIGKPLMTTDKKGFRVLRNDGNTMFFTGNNRPDADGDNMSFIDAVSVRNGKRTNLWMGKAPYVEDIVRVVSASGKGVTFISRRQSNKEIPNYHLVTVKGGNATSKKLTDFENPLPQMMNIQDIWLTYHRADGVKMTGRLYLPAGYDKERDGKLPVVMWTYPYEYQSRAEAEKYRVPRYNYPVPNRARLMHWATKGYAVLMGFSMPIIAPELKGKPNDSLVEQMIMNAEAAINCLDSIGVGDRNRVVVGGHSYGAFMTANLLTHTKLFKAGMAESGAYNRSLTPFGFQHEGRTYWKAQKMYNKVSPFNYADKLSGHLLLVHGTMDDNTGTFPLQSERMYYAVAGCGKDADYVQLPYEAHTYVYIENILHNTNEQWKVLENYVKNAKVAENTEK